MSKIAFQFKISLTDIEPVIWRRIIVPAIYSFWDFHVAIQDAMGWQDYHLHVFRIKKKHAKKGVQIGIPNEDRLEDEPDKIPGWEVPIFTYFTDIGMSCQYEYDFGDGWIHRIVLEDILREEKEQKYPKCIDGERACPPEDVGGTTGYEHLLEVLSNPQNKEYKEKIEWLGREYNPDEFSSAEVKFDDPKKRWERAFTETGEGLF